MQQLLSIEDFIEQVDSLMQEHYAIDISDAGIDREQLYGLWKEGDQPDEFVQWFGRKYDLTRVWKWNSE